MAFVETFYSTGMENYYAQDKVFVKKKALPAENWVPIIGKTGKTGFQSLEKRRNRVPMIGKPQAREGGGESATRYQTRRKRRRGGAERWGRKKGKKEKRKGGAMGRQGGG
ncbi:MAG: hypothetical protein IK066_12850, partial [Kiritimatiellae bacterium]|nr:hypothetical protein [Kiritimatiellia bacterium]